MARRINIITLITLIFIAICPWVTSANIINNGSFESDNFNPADAWVRVYSGENKIPYWDVVDGNVDWVLKWTAAGGILSIDLNGDMPGSIQQSFETEIGSQYCVTFLIAGNPDSFELGYEKILYVWCDYPSSQSRAIFTFSTEGKSVTNMGWEEKSFIFIADELQTNLRFGSDTPGGWGPVIDNVSVVKVNSVPLPPTVFLLGSGLLGLFGWRRFRKG
jgi:choice-of-anchor C domain-containing protein